MVLFADWRAGWPNLGLWVACLAVIALLGALRSSTDAEYAFASLALFPILAVAWYGGLAQGLVAAAIAAGMWTLTDHAAGREFSAPWVPWANSATRLLTYALVAALASRLRGLIDHERENAVRDPLTGLLNYRGLLADGEAEVARSKRHSRPLAVVFIDLDRFKQLNDRRGHREGNRALLAVAGALQHSVRSTDRVARIGGDEFVVLLPETGYEAAVATARKVSRALGESLARFPPVAASAGVAWFASATRPLPALLEAADALMYEAKQQGGDAVRAARFEDEAAGDGANRAAGGDGTPSAAGSPTMGAGPPGRRDALDPERSDEP